MRKKKQCPRTRQNGHTLYRVVIPLDAVFKIIILLGMPKIQQLARNRKVKNRVHIKGGSKATSEHIAGKSIGHRLYILRKIENGIHRKVASRTAIKHIACKTVSYGCNSLRKIKCRAHGKRIPFATIEHHAGERVSGGRDFLR